MPLSSFSPFLSPLMSIKQVFPPFVNSSVHLNLKHLTLPAINNAHKWMMSLCCFFNFHIIMSYVVFTARHRHDQGNVFSCVCLSVCLFTGGGPHHTGPTPSPTVQGPEPSLFHWTCSNLFRLDLNIQRSLQTSSNVFTFGKGGSWHSI